jgi:hypothetical protein
MQHRPVLVGKTRAFIEMTARQRTEPIEVRLDVA